MSVPRATITASSPPLSTALLEVRDIYTAYGLSRVLFGFPGGLAGAVELLGRRMSRARSA